VTTTPPHRPLDPDRLAPAAAPGIRILPTIHERVDLAAVTRAVLEAVNPVAVAVELPMTLHKAVEEGVRRLPRVSVVLSEEPQEDALIWVVTPGDPLVEGLRWATERDRPRFLIDPDVRYTDQHRDPVPDPYALWNLGPEEYLEILVEAGAERPVSDADHLREAGMAYFLQQARAQLDEQGVEGDLLALVGAAHVERLRDLVQRPAARPLTRAHRSHVELRHLHPDSFTGLLTDPPLAHAVHEQLRGGEVPEPPPLEETVSRRVSLIRHGLRLITGEKDDAVARRRRAIPSYAAHHAAAPLFPGGRAVERRALGAVVWRIAAESYGEQTQERLANWQRRCFFDFAHRFARTEGLLVPGLYEWVVAARGVADDNFAWEIFDAARAYPWQEEGAEIPTVRLDGEHLDLGTRKVRFRRRFFRVKQRPVRLPMKQRPQTDDPESWLEGFDSAGICSFPKEDLVIEDYSRFLQKKAISILSAENQRTEPFSASLLDGIDVRETLRNLHEGKIYVQELGRAPGEAGSVVVIFDRDLEDRAFPYAMTWHGEHEQESDMAFYATNPYEQVVGPGITRATYGGFLMTYPPGRLYNVWEDRDYRFAQEKAEVLILAAIDYSQQKIVVHVAKDPPAGRMKDYAALQGKRLLHIPLAALSPMTLKKIRVVHLLAGHDKRSVADQYIW
jgi:hypothetical protein